jgi:hypothetical protein
MRPIVDGLEAEYGDQIDFHFLDAEDGSQGEAAFRAYALRGHPTVMIVEAGGEVAWIRPGIIPEEELEREILTVIEP